jgi:FixJ family two-component response regulator
MKAGAVDFLEKPADDRRLLAVVRRAVEKDRQRRSIAASQPEIAARLARLTPRERQTMHLLYEGKAIKAIATELDIGFQTAAKHRARVLEKLELANETELARLLDRLGAEA